MATLTTLEDLRVATVDYYLSRLKYIDSRDEKDKNFMNNQRARCRLIWDDFLEELTGMQKPIDPEKEPKKAHWCATCDGER